MKIFAIMLAGLLILTPPVLCAQETPSAEEGMVSLDFHDVDIKDVVKAISEISGKNFLMDDRVRGKVSIISPSPVTVKEAYQAFISALEVKNLCAVEVGSVTKIVPLRECKYSPIVTETDREKVEGDQPVTRLIPLRFISANEIRQALNPMVSKTGSIVAYGPTNTLIITDGASNIRRLSKIIEKLDKKGNQATTENIPLRYAQASDVAQKLSIIFEEEKRGAKSVRRSSDVEGGAEVSKIIPDDRTNSILVTATRSGLQRVLDLLESLDRKVEVAVDRNRIHVYKLQHADAEELSGILAGVISGATGATVSKKGSQSSRTTSASPAASKGNTESGTNLSVSSPSGSLIQASGGMFEDEVRIVADPATNALVITATPNDYQSLVPVIEQLDSRRPQVFVEALIMEVNVTKALEVGLAGHGGSGVGKDGGVLGGMNLGNMSTLGAAVTPASAAGALTGSGLVLGGGSSQTFGIPGTNLRIPIGGAMFRALQTSSVINILSAPNILTTDNKKAEIRVGDEVPFKKGTHLVAGMTENIVDRQSVGLKLEVTPQINEGDTVTLEIVQEIKKVKKDKGDAVDLVTSDRAATTTVVAENGQTIVIGGLIEDVVEKSTAKVPLLGDIPLLGHLFRSTSRTKTKMNLVIFLTPHVIHDPMDMTRVSVKKNNERRKFYKKEGVEEFPALYDYDLDKGLNMAPPPEPEAKKIEREKKPRFDYDRPQESEVSVPLEQDIAQRRRPLADPDFDTFADIQPVEDTNIDSTQKKPLEPVSNDGNPFADVRPPSSTN